jgi:dCTP deaminase
MILSGREILRHIGREIVIEPFDKSRINPNSYNLSLAANCWFTKPTFWI